MCHVILSQTPPQEVLYSQIPRTVQSFLGKIFHFCGTQPVTANTLELFGLTNGHKLQEIFTSFPVWKEDDSLHLTFPRYAAFELVYLIVCTHTLPSTQAGTPSMC